MTQQSWHRRHAIQLAAQLPDNIDDARAVIRYLTELLEDFLCRDESPAPAPLRLVPPDRNS
jgi:hypothetical protein